MTDFIHALRQLRKHPGFTVVAVLTLALGIGANSVVFSVAKTLLLRPLGVEAPQRLAWVRWILPTNSGREDLLSWPDLEDLRAAAQSFDHLAMFSSTELKWTTDNQVSERRFLMSLVTAYAALALGVAVIGIVGVVSYQVSQRTNEFGVRLALGATRGGILRLVLGLAFRLVLAGVLVGVPCSLAANRLLSSHLFALSPHDPALMGTTVAVMFLVTLAASYLPARRASRIEPMKALRDF